MKSFLRRRGEACQKLERREGEEVSPPFSSGGQLCNLTAVPLELYLILLLR